MRAARASICLGRLATAKDAWALLFVAVIACGGCRRGRFPARGDAAAVVVVSPHRDAASPPTVAEQEPNDKPEQAQLLALNPDWPVLSVDGELAASGQGGGKDVDVFKLVVPGRKDAHAETVDSAGAEDIRLLARRLSLEVAAGAGGGLALQLLDEAAKTIEAVAVASSESAGMPNMGVLPGRTYFVRIKAGAKSSKAEAVPSGNSYKLSVQLSDFELAEEREPDDSLASAQPVAMTGAADFSGFIGWAHDQDFYRVPAAEVVSALDVDVEAVLGVALGLQVRDGSGSRIAVARGRKGERLALRNVTVPAGRGDASPSSNFFYVVVRGESGQNRNQRYVLHLSMGSSRQDSEVEPNDNGASATVIHDGTFTGYLPIGDVDYFRYAEEGSRELSIEADCPARVRCTLEVVRAKDGHALASAEAKKAKQAIVVARVLTEGEPVLIRLAQDKGDGNANEPYVLKFSSEPVAIPKTGTLNSPSP
jgi:hypothetical protein